MQNKLERRQWTALIALLLITFAVAAFGSQFSPDAWYRDLVKPEFNPPSAVFAPVWTALYTLMAIAAWLVWRSRQRTNVVPAMAAYGVQLALNGLWSWLFFGRHEIGLALVDIGLLWGAIVVTMLLFWRVRPAAALLLVPYLLWVSFALLLNLRFWQLNP